MKSIVLMSVAIAIAFADEVHIKAAVAAYQAGATAVRQHEFQSAVADFEKAIEIEPTFLEPRRSLIKAYLDSGQRLQAGTCITQLLEIEPGDVPDRLILAQILLEEKQSQRALAQFSLVLQDEPFNADALYGFASTAKVLGMDARAQDALRRGRKHYPDDKRFQPLPDAEK